MPASEDFYRSPSRLHMVFMYSSLALLATTIWMMAVDHLRPWKQYQREFERLKKERLADQATAANQKIDKSKLVELEAQQAAANKSFDDKKSAFDQIQNQMSGPQTTLLVLERRLADEKAIRSEVASNFDLIVKEQVEAEAEAGGKESARVKKLEQAKEKILEKLAEYDKNILEKTKEIEGKQAEVKGLAAQAADLEKGKEEAKRAVDAVASDYARLKRSADDAGFGWAKMLLGLPIIDGFANPLRVQQIVLEDLPWNNNFKWVKRHDRCMTCHQGIDKPGYTQEAGVKHPFQTHPGLDDLFLGARSPHPVDKFGCTVCHQGQGTATSFEWASHTPASQKQKDEWTNKHGYFFNHFHETPMRPSRFVEASCLKCHHDPYEIPQAKKLLLGYQTIRSHGCFGCHEINGYKEDGTPIGPHLKVASMNDSAPYTSEQFVTDNGGMGKVLADAKLKTIYGQLQKQEADRKNELRKVGPSLMRAAEKLDENFLWSWVRKPTAFRPTTKMPQFFHQLDVGFYDSTGPKGEFANEHGLADLANTEIHAVAKFLLHRSQEWTAKAKPVALHKVDAKGDATKGKDLFATKGCVACHQHHEHPEQAGAGTQFGPELSGVGVKFKSDAQKAWLKSWIKEPARFSPMTFMPSLQLSDQDAADIAEYLTASGTKAEPIERTKLDEQALADMVQAIVGKSLPSQAAADQVAKMSKDEQLLFLGEKTVTRLGCFGCHDIPGYEKAKSIGVPLADWAKKNPHKLAFENVHEYIHEKMEHEPTGELATFYKNNDYFLTQLDNHQREAFLMQKLRESRSYDYKKIRLWQDRARMPQFNFTDEQREAVATVVLGLIAEPTHPKYVYNPPPAKRAQITGRSLLDQYNCTACHVIEPGQYKYTPTEEKGQELAALGKKQLGADHFFAGHSAWDAKPNAGLAMTLKGLPAGRENPEEADDPRNALQFIQLWESTSLLNQSVPAGTKVGIPATAIKAETYSPMVGGHFAERLVESTLKKVGKTFDAGERDKVWARVPPPLIREGEKVQTNWLYRFLRDPVSIRPAVMLRMPRFNYRVGDVEALADYFAARDGVPYPYFDIAERKAEYLDQHDKDYLIKGLGLVTNKDLCIKCHPVGGYDPSGKPEELGPSLARAPQRLRPDWMLRWIANPKRLVPFTGMPVNFAPDKEQFQTEFKGTSLEQAKGARDVLVNYDAVLEQLIPRKKAPEPAAPPAGN